MTEGTERPDRREPGAEDEAPEKGRSERPAMTPVEGATEGDGPGILSGPLGMVFNLRMLRRVVQLLFFLGINAYVMASWYGGDAIVGFWRQFGQVLPTLPIIAPLEAPAAVLAGSFDTMQREFTSGVFPFFTLGAMIIILVVLGRTACGWVCPIGTVQDFATLPNRSKIRPAPGTEKEFRRIKAYLFIMVMFFVLWVGVSKVTGTEERLVEMLGPFADAAFAPWNPAYIIFVESTRHVWPTGIDNLWVLLQWPTVFWLQVVFIAVIVVGSFWFPRWFCRWLCPAGWFYGLFSKDALIGIGRNPARCTPDTCNLCEVVCPMNIQIRSFPYERVHSPDCIMCLECKSHCPTKAIQIRFI